jgi:hypothetical protein
VVRVAGSADLVLLEPDQPESVPALYTLDFLRRVVRLMAPGAALLCASSSPRLRGALLRLGLTVGHVRSPALPQGGTVAAWQPQTVRVPLPDSERRLACASAAGIPYRDRGLNWTRTRILQYHGRLVDRVRRRIHPTGLTAESPPQPAAGPPLEDAPR